MSEYQWYEFVALDRPLSAREMAGLRAISTRAEISPGGRRRTVGERLERADLARQRRERDAAKRRVRERAAVVAARTKQLVALEPRQDGEWAELDGSSRRRPRR